LYQSLLTLESQPGVGSSFHVYLPLPDLQGQPSRLPTTTQSALLLLSTQAQVAPEILAVVERQQMPLRRPRDVRELTALLFESAAYRAGKTLAPHNNGGHWRYRSAGWL
jgi:hypothetical protein